MRKGISPIITVMLLVLIMMGVATSVSVFVLNQQEQVAGRLSAGFGEQLNVVETVCNERNLTMRIKNTGDEQYDTGKAELLIREDGVVNDSLTEPDVTIKGDFQNARGTGYFNYTMDDFFRSGKEYEISLGLDTGKEISELCRGGYRWWDRDWLYRKNIMINNTQGESFEDAILKVPIDTETPISQGKMRSDCMDIRVVEKTTEREHNVEANTCNKGATNISFRANVSEGYQSDIYIYYGNLRGEDIEEDVSSKITGTGDDGDKTVQEEETVNNYTSINSINEEDDNTVVGVESSEGFRLNDEVLILQNQGGKPGNYSFERIRDIQGEEIHLFGTLDKSFETEEDEVQLINVPQYQELTIEGTIIPEKYSEGKGGVVALRAEEVEFNEEGFINASEKGFGTESENQTGEGPGGGESDNCGGGAGHLEDGEDGDCGASGGTRYGREEDSLALGSQGGGATGCSGGRGGGVVFVSSAELTGANIITYGGKGEDSCGGGSGGSILVHSSEGMTTDTISSSGGVGEESGGDGSSGVIDIQASENIGGRDYMTPTESLQEIVGFKMMEEEER